MKKITTKFLLNKTIMLMIVLLCAGTLSVNAQCRLLNETFDVNPVLAPGSVDGAWYPDRFRPAGFASDVLAGNNVLKISIDGIGDGAAGRPPGQQGTFYNTQGRKFNQCGGCVTVAKGDLWVPADWATDHRRSDMWATGFNNSNAVVVYPIIGFRNPDALTPGIYFWDGNVGWINSGVTVAYNSWYNLGFRINGANIEYMVNNVVVGTVASGGATYFGDIMMQAYNFNDPLLPVASQSTDSYDAYWDNIVTTGTGGNVVTNTNTGQTFCSIQAAINSAATLDGHTIQVGPGVYNENVLINKNNLVLRSLGGKAVTTIQGITTPGAGAVMVANGINGVTIGQPGKGFTVIGFDGNGSIESAAVYLLGSHTNITVEDNEIRAAGDHGLLSNFNAAIDGIFIKGNMFTGTTFLGASPGGCGFGTQFDPGNNVPRQLVTMGGGAGVTLSKNVYFLNNTVTGTAGGFNADPACAAFGQGNNLVTIDVIGCTITGNIFNGITTRFSNSLRTRGPGASIYCNTFYNGGLGAVCDHIFFGGSAPLVGASPSTLAGVATANSFPGGGGYVNPGTGATFIIFRDLARANTVATGLGGGNVAITTAVSANCSVLNVNTGLTYQTIQAAIDNPFTLNGHTIQVSAGTYNGNVTIGKAITLRGANAGVSGCGSRGIESTIQNGEFSIASNGVTIDGFEFTGTGARVASQGALATWSNIAIVNNYIHATTAQQPILHGFGSGGGVGSSDWTVSNNKIADIQSANSTAIVLFNITNAAVNNNCISHTNASFAGRRGINADGLQNATINGNTIDMGDASPTTTTNAPWAIQVSMSDRDAVSHSINGNTISNAYRSIQGLSQRNLTGLTIHNNDLINVSLGVDLNTGGAVPAIPQPVQSGISIDNNNIVTITPTIPGALGAGVRLRNLHNAAVNGPVSYSNVDINENSFTVTAAAMIFEAGLNISTENATCNWYGTTNNAVVATKISGPVTYIPYLLIGTDNSPATGFQPVPGSCAGGVPKLSTTINSVTVNANNDGNDDLGSFTVCNSTNNILFNSFTDQNGLTNPNLRVYQTFTASNVTVPFCNNCSATMAAFAGATGSAALINPALPGTLTMRFRSWIDANTNGNVDPSELASDWIQYTITVNGYPALQSTLNTITLTNNRDGNDETATLVVCNTADNLHFTGIIDVQGVTPAASVKVKQETIRTNVTFSGAADGVYPIGSFPPDFFRTVALINPAMSGTLVIRRTIFFDINNNNNIDANECANDGVVYTINVDGEAPVLTVPANVTADCDGIPAVGSASAVDALDPNPTVIYLGETFTAGSCPNNFTLTRTWSATDACGNTTTASQTITVVDNTPPTLTVPANVTLQCSDPLPLMPLNINSSPNLIAGTYNLGTAVFGPALTSTPVTGNAMLVNDGAGNTADACEPILNNLAGKIAVLDRGGCAAPNGLFTNKVLKAQNAGAIAVIVVNSNPGDVILTMGGSDPSITIPSVFVSNNYGNALKAEMAMGTVNVSLSASPLTVIDNCSTPVITFTQSFTPGSCPGSYTLMNTWTATDACGNATTASQTITVADNTPPTLTVPANVTLQCSDPLPLMPLNINSSPNLIAGTYNLGTAVFGPALTSTPVTGNAMLVNDGAGNTADACEPILNNLAGKIAVLDRGGCAAPNGLFTNKVLKAQNAGAIAVIVVNSAPGNSVLTMGGTDPSITIPSVFVSKNYGNALKAEMALGTVNISLSASSITFSDNCSSPVISYSQVYTAGNCPGNYTLLNTWTATDACGNATTASQTITVVDNTPPMIVCPGPQNKTTDPGSCYYTAMGEEFNPTSASDNCGAVTISNNFNNSNTLAGAQFPIGTTNVVWTATDLCGNQATCNFNVTVTDNQNATGYIIYAEKDVEFGEYNYIGGDVGVTDAKGKAKFKKYSVLNPYRITSKNIDVDLPSSVTNRVYSPATGGPTPTFMVYTGSTSGLSNIDITVNGTLNGNWKDVKVKKGITCTITGNNFGKITIEEGANVTFTANMINLEKMDVHNGKKQNNILTVVNFRNPSSVKVKDKVEIGDDCRVNVGGPKVTFYMGDNSGGEEKFEVKGENSQVTANIMIPNGKLHVHGGKDINRPTIMTGWYIIEKLDSHEKYVYWNKYDCGAPVAPFAPPIVTSKEEPIVEPVVTVAEKPVPFEVRAYPNPSSVSFSIVVKSPSLEPIVVKVMDMSGKVLSVISNVSKGSVINLGSELRGGTYIAEVTQGKNRQTIKLVKLN